VGHRLPIKLVVHVAGTVIGRAQPRLTTEQRQWLEGRQELVLGPRPDYPPFDITSGGRDYQA
jgi:two-component system sensor histidine kinase EvgS